MELPTKEDIKKTIEALKLRKEWLKQARPDQIQAYRTRVNSRPLTEQPRFNPRQRSEQLLQDS